MASSRNRTFPTWGLDALFLTIVLGGLFFTLLGTRPLFVPDEGRYAEIAREMLISGDYITPYLNHVKYFEKPILYYWLSVAAFKLGGLNIWSIRCINALLGVIGCLMSYATARELYGRLTGIYAALILGTSVLYFAMAHMISLDLPVTILISASLYAFLLSQRLQPSWGYVALSAIFAGLAVLTKGLIGILFPIMVISIWVVILGRWRHLKSLHLPSFVIIFLLTALPWHIFVQLNHPEFFNFYIIEQHFLRYTDLHVGHYQPFWFFIPNLFLGFIPWVVFLPQAILASLPTWKDRAKSANEIFFLTWACIVLLFFSFSKSKLIPYILPLMPPLAILTARYLANASRFRLGIRIGFATLPVIAALISLGFYLFLRNSPMPDPRTAMMFLTEAAGIFTIGTIVAALVAYKRATNSIIIIIASTWVFLIALLTSLPAIDTRTILPFAKQLKPMLTPQDDVVAFKQYYQDLPFYLERRITVVDWRNELSYGMQHQDTQDWMINEKTFWQRFNSKQRVWAIMSRDEFDLLQKNRFKMHSTVKYYLWNKTINNVLICNRRLPPDKPS